MPAIRRCAARIASRLGAVFAVNVEHLLEYFLHGCQGVERAGLDGVQDPPQLRVALDGMLEVRLRPPGCDGEHLSGQILPPPLLEEPLALEVRTVRLDLLPELGDVLVPRR